MASETSLFALIPKKHQEDPVDQTNGAWFPSLKLIASQALAVSIIKKILKISNKTGLWKTDPWIEIQTLLHESLPQLLLEEIYKNYFYTSVESPYTCGFCEGVLKKVVNLNLWREVISPDDIEHKVIAWKLFHRLDVPYNESRLYYGRDIKYLSNHSLYVTELEFNTHSYSLEDIEESLKGLPHLRSIHMNFYNRGNQDGKEFELLQRFCKLERFGIFCHSVPHPCQFIKFLESQSNFLKELTLQYFTIHHQKERFWDVLTHMSNLEKLNCDSNFMNEIQEIPDLEPCQQISSLRIYLDEDQDIESLETERLFPNLDNLHLGGFEGEEFEIKDAEIMKKVTTLNIYSKDIPIDPFELMSFVPNAQKLDLVIDFRSPPDTQSILPVMLHLTELNFEIENPITQDEFSALFRSLPNIVKMWLILAGLSSYQEEIFTNFVDASVNSLKKLRVLHLQFYDHPPSMTGKTVCAIVKNSCLKEFKDLSKFMFTSEDFEHLKILASKHQLVITPKCQHLGHKFHVFQR